MKNKEAVNYCDRRLTVVFQTIEDYRDEFKVVCHLIEFMYHYYLITGINRNPDCNKVFRYYIENIIKPNSIEKMMMDMSVQIDVISYIDEYYNQIILIKSGMNNEGPALVIDKTLGYDRKHHLNLIEQLISSNNGQEEIREIIDYLSKKGITRDNISNEYICRIIKKIYLVL